MVAKLIIIGFFAVVLLHPAGTRPALMVLGVVVVGLLAFYRHGER